MHHVLLSRAPASEPYFIFFSSKVPHKIIFTKFKCLAIVALRCTWLGLFSLLYSHLRWSFCGVMLLHVTRVWAGGFAVLAFLHSSILEFGRGYAIKQLLRGTGITRPLHTPEQDQVYRSWWKLQASAFQQETVLGLFHLFYLNGSRTLRGPHASVDRVDFDLYTILNYWKQI